MAAFLVAAASACGSSTAPKSPTLVGTWDGAVAAKGSRAAAGFHITIIPQGNSYNGFGTAGPYVYLSAVPILLSDNSVSLTLVGSPDPLLFYTGKLDGNKLRGTVYGGIFVDDSLTLTR